MKAPKRPYPSFTFVLTQQSRLMGLPTHEVSPIRPNKRIKTCRMLDLEDPLMRPVGGRYDIDGVMPNGRLASIRDDEDSSTMINLKDAIYSQGDAGQKRLRRLSLSTLVIDLAFTVGRKLSPCVPQ